MANPQTMPASMPNENQPTNPAINVANNVVQAHPELAQKAPAITADLINNFLIIAPPKELKPQQTKDSVTRVAQVGDMFC